MMRQEGITVQAIAQLWQLFETAWLLSEEIAWPAGEGAKPPTPEEVAAALANLADSGRISLLDYSRFVALAVYVYRANPLPDVLPPERDDHLLEG